MKKSLFLFAACSLFAMNSNAQTALATSQTNQNLVKANVLQKIDREPTAYDAKAVKAAKAARKTIANGVHYNRPEGILFNAWTEEWRYIPVSYMYSPHFYDFKITNDCTTPQVATWTMTTGEGNEYDLAELGFIDENNDYIYSTTCSGNGYWAPRIHVQSDSYLYGETLHNGKAAENASHNAIFPDTIGNKSFFASYPSQHYSFGSFDSGFLYGTGSFVPSKGDFAGQTFVSEGVIQYYSKPASPLYVEHFYLPIFSSYPTAIPADKYLRVVFRECEEQDGDLVATDKVLYDLKVTAEDLTLLPEEDNSSEYTKSGEIYEWTMKVANKVPGAFGGWVEEPMVFDKPFCVIILGCEQEGVDVGFMIDAVQPDDPVGNGVTICHALAYNENDDLYSLYYGEDTRLTMFFVGGFDYVETLASYTDQDGTTYNDINVLRVDANGYDVENVGWPDGLGSNAVCFVAYNWLDYNSQNENYWDEDMPEWIVSLDGQEVVGEYGYDGQVMLTVECEPLTSGGRYAAINLQGKGYKSAEPLFILQGDITLEEAKKDYYEAQGINEISAGKTNATTGVFNLNGQRVNPAQKGLVIANGKKLIRK